MELTNQMVDHNMVMWGHFGATKGCMGLLLGYKGLSGSVRPYWGQQGQCGAILGPKRLCWAIYGAKKGSVWPFCWTFLGQKGLCGDIFGPTKGSVGDILALVGNILGDIRRLGGQFWGTFVVWGKILWDIRCLADNFDSTKGPVRPLWGTFAILGPIFALWWTFWGTFVVLGHNFDAKKGLGVHLMKSCYHLTWGICAYALDHPHTLG